MISVICSMIRVLVRDQMHGRCRPDDREGKYGRGGRSGRYGTHDSGITVEQRQVTEDRRNDSHARDGLDNVLMLVELEVAMQVGTRSRRVR